MLQPLPKSDGRSSANCPRPACPTTMAVQTPKPFYRRHPFPPSLTATGTSRSVQGAKSCVIYVMMTERENLFTLISVCPVTPVAAPRAPVVPSSVTSAPAVRPPAPQPVTVRPSGPSSITTVSAPPQPPSNIMTQRVLLSPDMQARLPCKLISSHFIVS